MTDLCHGARNPPRKASPVILLLSTSDTDLLSARASQEAGDGVSYRWANPPSRLLVSEDLPPLLDGVDLVIVRILGSRRSWEDGLDMVLASGLPRSRSRRRARAGRRPHGVLDGFRRCCCRGAQLPG